METERKGEKRLLPNLTRTFEWAIKVLRRAFCRGRERKSYGQVQSAMLRNAIVRGTTGDLCTAGTPVLYSVYQYLSADVQKMTHLNRWWFLWCSSSDGRCNFVACEVKFRNINELPTAAQIKCMWKNYVEAVRNDFTWLKG